MSLIRRIFGNETEVLRYRNVYITEVNWNTNGYFERSRVWDAHTNHRTYIFAYVRNSKVCDNLTVDDKSSPFP